MAYFYLQNVFKNWRALGLGFLVFTASVGSIFALSPVPIEFREISAGVYVHIGKLATPDDENLGDASNLGLIIGEDSVMVVDSGGSAAVGQEIWEAIGAITDLPVKYLVITHVHPDHIYGAKSLTDLGAEMIGHGNLASAVAAREESYAQNYAQSVGDAALQNADIPDVNIEIEEPTEIDLGNRVIQLIPMPVAHTNNDLTVFDQESGVLFLGDLLFEDHVPVIDGSLRGWQSVMGEIDLSDVSTVVPGHGKIVQESIDAETVWGRQSGYFNVLEDDAKTAIDAGEFMSNAIKTIGQSERDNWVLFDEFNARNASVVFSELEWE